MSALLELAGVLCRYRDGAREVTVLDGVDFDVHPGELVGVHGERRAGKSTLMRIASGLQRPDAGTVSFDGEDIRARSRAPRPSLWRRGGMALARGDVPPLRGEIPVIEHVALPLSAEGWTLIECEGLVRPVLERVGISQISHEPVDRLSLSDRVRVELAGAIAREPRLLLVDEPAVLPSPSDARSLAEVLRGLGGDGIAVVIASEDLVALAGVDRFLTLGDGRLRATDSRRRVIEFPGPRGLQARA